LYENEVKMKGWNRIHAYAHCDECDWDYTDICDGIHHHKIGVEAQRHADETGHRVSAEIGFAKDFIAKSRTPQ
jgi:hypothetical protein